MLHWPLQVDVKVANKSIVRLQNQMDAKEQELGALNIKVWYHNSTGCVIMHMQLTSHPLWSDAGRVGYWE